MLYVTDDNNSSMKEWISAQRPLFSFKECNTNEDFKSLGKFYQPFSGLTVTLKRNKNF